MNRNWKEQLIQYLNKMSSIEKANNLNRTLNPNKLDSNNNVLYDVNGESRNVIMDLILFMNDSIGEQEYLRDDFKITRHDESDMFEPVVQTEPISVDEKGAFATLYEYYTKDLKTNILKLESEGTPPVIN